MFRRVSEQILDMNEEHLKWPTQLTVQSWNHFCGQARSQRETKRPPSTLSLEMSFLNSVLSEACLSTSVCSYFSYLKAELV